MPELPVVFEVGTFVVLGLVLLFDLLLVVKRPHEPSMKEAGLWVGFYVGLALLFAAAMFVFTGPEFGSQFVAGWVTEYSLSIDNLFVFIIIMARFSVPRKYQQEVLMFGIIIALILRGVFIIIGAAVIENFSWVFFIFGAFLLWTAYKQATDNGEDEEEGSDNKLIGKLRNVLPMTDKFDQNKIRTVVNGKKVFTPMLIVFITIGVTDLMFAVDSIPAIFGLTQSAFIVFTANIFALMGLRQLYFLLGGLMDRLIYLKHGLSVILAFIGVKLILHALHVNELPFINGGEHVAWAPEIPTFVSLAVILGTIVIATVASLLSPKAKAVQAVASLENALKIYRNLGEDAPHHERVEAYELVDRTYRAAAAAAQDRADVALPDIAEDARERFLASDPRSARPGSHSAPDSGSESAPVSDK